jgi:hypothetical protein
MKEDSLSTTQSSCNNHRGGSCNNHRGGINQLNQLVTEYVT